MEYCCREFAMRPAPTIIGSTSFPPPFLLQLWYAWDTPDQNRSTLLENALPIERLRTNLSSPSQDTHCLIYHIMTANSMAGRGFLESQILELHMIWQTCRICICWSGGDLLSAGWFIASPCLNRIRRWQSHCGQWPPGNLYKDCCWRSDSFLIIIQQPQLPTSLLSFFYFCFHSLCAISVIYIYIYIYPS